MVNVAAECKHNLAALRRPTTLGPAEAVPDSKPDESTQLPLAAALCAKRHLRKTTWLVLRGHEQKVASRHHAVLDFRVEADISSDQLQHADTRCRLLVAPRSKFQKLRDLESRGATDSTAVGVLCVGELIGIGVLALAHEDDLNPAKDTRILVGEEPGDDLRDQMHALLEAKPSTEAHQCSTRVFVQAQRSLELPLSMRLALQEVRQAIVPRDVRVRPGIPLVRNTVQDAGHAHLPSLLGQDGVQALATLRALDLTELMNSSQKNSENHERCSAQASVLSVVVVAFPRRLCGTGSSNLRELVYQNVKHVYVALTMPAGRKLPQQLLLTLLTEHQKQPRLAHRPHREVMGRAAGLWT